jgi:hypothetical protein
MHATELPVARGIDDAEGLLHLGRRHLAHPIHKRESDAPKLGAAVACGTIVHGGIDGLRLFVGPSAVVCRRVEVVCALVQERQGAGGVDAGGHATADLAELV